MSHAPLLTTLAAASVRGGPLHAHGPALLGDEGEEAAETVERVAASRGVTAMIWDSDAPTEHDGVRRLVQDTSAKLLVFEWEPQAEDGLAEELLAAPPCDVLLVSPGDFAVVNEIVVALGPGPNAPLVAALARQWSSAFGVPARALHVVATPQQVPAGEDLCQRLAPDLKADVVIADVPDALAAAVATSGFLAVGASEHLGPAAAVVASGAGELAQRGTATIVVARTRPDRRLDVSR